MVFCQITDVPFFVTDLADYILPRRYVATICCNLNYRNLRHHTDMIIEMGIICAKKLHPKKFQYRFFVVHYRILESVYTHHQFTIL